MLKRVRLNTCVVDGSREARTVLAIKAAFVESEAGNLQRLLAYFTSSGGIHYYVLCLRASPVIKRENIDTH